jgi:hypothetical protein
MLPDLVANYRSTLCALCVLQCRSRGLAMVSINEELEAAKAAQAAINTILTAARKSEVLTTLKNAYRVAVLNYLSSRGLLNEARGIVGIAISNVMHGLPTEDKINKAKSAIDTWIKELDGSL